MTAPTVQRSRVTGRDWAAAPEGTCTRCGHHNVLVLPWSLPEPADDDNVDVVVCPPCHPRWEHQSLDLPKGKTFTDLQLQAINTGDRIHAERMAGRR